MAYDRKYGKITLERGSHIPDDEPVVVFRGRDRLLPALLAHYIDLCEDAGARGAHISFVYSTLDQINGWQRDNETVTPSSETLVDDDGTLR